jgi:hypothetical protein
VVGVPAVKPDTTRAGMPSRRASTVIAQANCTQIPFLALVRKVTRPAASWKAGPRVS